MVEPEMAFATLDDLMVLAEQFLSFLVTRAEPAGPGPEGAGARRTASLKQCSRPFRESTTTRPSACLTSFSAA